MDSVFVVAGFAYLLRFPHEAVGCIRKPGILHLTDIANITDVKDSLFWFLARTPLSTGHRFSVHPSARTSGLTPHPGYCDSCCSVHGVQVPRFLTFGCYLLTGSLGPWKSWCLYWLYLFIPAALIYTGTLFSLFSPTLTVFLKPQYITFDVICFIVTLRDQCSLLYGKSILFGSV